MGIANLVGSEVLALILPYGRVKGGMAICFLCIDVETMYRILGPVLVHKAALFKVHERLDIYLSHICQGQRLNDL